MRLDRLLGQEEPLADLTVHEALGDELKHLDLARRRLLLELSEGPRERDYLAVAAARPPCRHGLEAARVVHIAAEDLLALCGVHGPYIGARRIPL